MQMFLECMWACNQWSLQFSDICFDIDLLSGARKNCFKDIDMDDCKKFLQEFWNMAKCEQDSFAAWMQFLLAYSFCCLTVTGNFLKKSANAFYQVAHDIGWTPLGSQED